MQKIQSVFSLIVLLIAGASAISFAETVYQDDFSGAAGSASATVPEVSKPGFSPVAYNAGLDGNGLLQASSLHANAGYRFQIASAPLNTDASIAKIKWTARFRTPTNDWIGIGFQGSGAAPGFLQSGSDTGPWIQFNANSSLIIRGGHAHLLGSAHTIAVADSGYNPGEVITAEFTYDVIHKKAELRINGNLIASDVGIVHVPEGTTTEAEPVILWAQLNLRSQQMAANGGAYVDSFMIEMIAPPASLKLIAITSAP